MSTALGLPDLDALDHAALKAMILEQQDVYRAEREKYSNTQLAYRLDRTAHAAGREAAAYALRH
jgi:hypothetical protein